MKRIVMLIVAIAIAMPSMLLAHEGHAHKTMGTVTTIQDNQIEVKDKEGKVTKHILDGKTKVRRGTSLAKAADIKVGDRVVVTTVETKDKAGKSIVTVTQVDVGTAPAANPAKK